MKIALIINPQAGGGKGKKMAPKICAYLQERHIDFDLFETEYPRHANEILKDLPLDSYTHLAAAGGDGTNFEMINGLLQNHDPSSIPPLLIIPVGRGNSFAAEFGIKNWRQALDRLLNGKIIPVDVIHFNHEESKFYFVNLIGFGFITDVAITANKVKFLGNLSYVYGVFYRMAKLEFYDIEMEIDGEKVSSNHLLTAVSNSKYTAGNMKIAPDADINDGYIDLVTADKMSRWELFKVFPKIYSGKHGEHPGLHFRKVKNLKVNTTPRKKMLPDGEIFGETPVEFGINPGMVSYLV